MNNTHTDGPMIIDNHFINEVAWHFKYSAENSGCLPDLDQVVCFDSGMNAMPKKHKNSNGMIFPADEMMLHWLRSYCGYNQAQIEDVDNRMTQLKRAEFDLSEPRMSLELDTNHENWDVESHPQDLPDNVVALSSYRTPHCTLSPPIILRIKFNATGQRQETHRNLALDMLARQSRTVHQNRKFLALTLNSHRKSVLGTGERILRRGLPGFQAQKSSIKMA